MDKLAFILTSFELYLPLVGNLVIPSWLHKIIFCLALCCAAALVSRILKKCIQRLLLHDNSSIPSVTIIINLMRLFVWGVIVSLIMEPVFGIKPTALLTALGVGGLALSLGIKDTIANTAAGIQIILGKILVPGNHIQINGYTGTVQDTNWRHTTVRGRLGEEISIPNSLLNTQTLIKIPDGVEEFTALPLILKHEIELETISKELVDLSYEVAGDFLADRESSPTSLKIIGFNQFGMQAELWLTVKPDKSKAGAKDLIARALNSSHCSQYIARSKEPV